MGTICIPVTPHTRWEWSQAKYNYTKYRAWENNLKIRHRISLTAWLVASFCPLTSAILKPPRYTEKINVIRSETCPDWQNYGVSLQYVLAYSSTSGRSAHTQMSLHPVRVGRSCPFDQTIKQTSLAPGGSETRILHDLNHPPPDQDYGIGGYSF